MVDTAALAPAIRRANSKALEILLQGDPVLIDVLPAKELIPELKEHTILHAGPPIEWDRMCGPMRGAVAGVAVFEGWARDLDEAGVQASKGCFEFHPNLSLIHI